MNKLFWPVGEEATNERIKLRSNMLLLMNSDSNTTLDTNYIGRNIAEFAVQQILIG